MKKQDKKLVDTNATPRVAHRKKGAVAVRRSEKEECQPTAAEDAMAASLVEEIGEDHWRKWWRPQVLVDEQMSWGSVWYSFGEVDDFQVFYGDVLVEDDIWDLRKPKQLPPT